MRKLLRPGDFTIDVGANHGWFSLTMAQIVGHEGKVVAFEPVPSTLRLLERQLELNPQVCIEVIPVALGDVEAKSTIYEFEGLPHGHASLSTLGRDDHTPFDVNVTTLDAVLRSLHRCPVLVKLDVEGAELAVLRGATGLLTSASPPIFLIEVNYETSLAFEYAPIDLLRFLQSVSSRRYRAYRVSGSAVAADLDPEHAAPGVTWLCVPENHIDRLIHIGVDAV